MSRRSASVWQYHVECSPDASLSLFWNSEPASRRLAFVFNFRVIWHSFGLSSQSCILFRRRDARRPFDSTLSNVFPIFFLALFGYLSRRRNGWRCDARRRFVNFVSCFIRGLVFAEYGVLCRRWDDWRLHARRWFASIAFYGFPKLLFV